MRINQRQSLSRGRKQSRNPNGFHKRENLLALLTFFALNVNLKLILDMEPNTISVKQLRNNFPAVLKALEKGLSYTLIYRSKPVAQLKPISNSHQGLKDLLNFPPFEFKTKKNAVELVREERS